MKTPLPPIPIELQRLRYVTGQALRSADLRDGLANEAQRRWWHNRAKHDSYGVATGLSVAVHDLPARESVLLVAPGVAYDCFGRELFVCTRRAIRLPGAEVQAGEDVTLLVRPPGDSHASDTPRRRSRSPVDCEPCAPRDCLGDEAELCWTRSELPDIRAGVPIARVRRGEDPAWLVEPVPFGARAAARARIGRGATIPGATDWQLWSADDDEILFGVQTDVDTTTTGFSRPPHYFAHFAGKAVPAELVDAFALTRHAGITVPLLHVTHATATRFRTRVFLPLGVADETFKAAFLRLYRRDVALCWFGIEPPPDSACESGLP